MTTSTGRSGARSACSTARLTVEVTSKAGKVFRTLLGGRWDRRATLAAYHAHSRPIRGANGTNCGRAWSLGRDADADGGAPRALARLNPTSRCGTPPYACA